MVYCSGITELYEKKISILKIIIVTPNLIIYSQHITTKNKINTDVK